ncbi:hypothetical protein EVAR_63855_1 [Eumeta japonica]|uniref:Uncharacterized protein n=1 Tax=Eumeta variegata TaxID=151549 RepID=A0A4C1SF66_EUMVA|nr:hypothetical protein EVAR_63855_1 [Eumeta japonica]
MLCHCSRLRSCSGLKEVLIINTLDYIATFFSDARRITITISPYHLTYDTVSVRRAVPAFRTNTVYYVISAAMYRRLRVFKCVMLWILM